MYGHVECDASYFRLFELLGWRRHAGDVVYGKRHRRGKIAIGHDIILQVLGRIMPDTTKSRNVVCDVEELVICRVRRSRFDPMSCATIKD